jgi:SAM-dependent methyltransferase
MEAEPVALSADVDAAAAALADDIVQRVDWRAALDAWAAFGNSVTVPLPAHVRCKRHTTAGWAPAGLSPPLRRELAKRLPDCFTAEARRDAAAVEIQITIHETGVLCEVLALKQRMDRDLPSPGMRRLESYVVAQAVRIQPSDVILDPFCGKATFLAETELCWPGASVIGVDSDPEQLDAAARNLASAGNATLLEASATALPLADDSVDAIISCPPFDRQYAAAGGLSELNSAAFAEMQRVLKPDGRASLLIDETSLEIAKRHWPGLCVLGPMPLGPWVRCVLCAWPGGDAWTAWDRRAWARRRDAALPGLEPVWVP